MCMREWVAGASEGEPSEWRRMDEHRAAVSAAKGQITYHTNKAANHQPVEKVDAISVGDA
jgi:hypothetical protein